MLETNARDGKEEIVNSVLVDVTGQKGWEVEEWVKENRGAWD